MYIVLVTNIPNPYRVPLFNELNRLLTKQGDRLLVVFAAEKYDRRKFELDATGFHFPFHVLGSKAYSLGNEEKVTFGYGDLGKFLKQEKPDVIISAGFGMATIKSVFHKIRFGCKLIIWSGSLTTEGKGFAGLRNFIRKRLVAKSDGFVAYGTRALKYLISLGADPKRAHIALNTVDTAFFSRETKKLKDLKKEQDNFRRLTYVGYLSERKRVDVLLDVFGELSKTRNDVSLHIIGDGSAKDQLMAKTKAMDLETKVIFHGFRQKEELPQYYAVTDLFLFQTGFDIWGLVLNEAMAAGLTCIASPAAGAVDDLIDEGRTGFVCKFEDTRKAADLIGKLLDDPRTLELTGQNAARFIEERAGITHSASGFIDAINSVKLKK